MSRRILHCITGLDGGGTEGALVSLVGPLADRGWSSAVLALRGEGRHSDAVRAAGLPLVHLGLERGGAAWAGLARALRLARGFDPTIVQGWMYHGNLAASVAALAAGGRRPVVWNVRQALHRPEADRALTRGLIRLGAHVPAPPDRLVFNSRVSARQHRELGYRSGGERFIPNGFDVARFRPDPEARSARRRQWGVPDDAPLVGMLARVHPVKNHAGFLVAAAALAATRPSVRFLVAGAGTEALPVGGLGDRLLRLGQAEDPLPVLQALDLLAAPSLSEAFPNAVGEAMACGVPCVATDVGDTADLLGDGGLLVAPDDPVALRGAMDQILSWEASRRRATGEAGRRRIVERYSLETVAEAWCGLYDELLEHS